MSVKPERRRKSSRESIEENKEYLICERIGVGERIRSVASLAREIDVPCSTLSAFFRRWEAEGSMPEIVRHGIPDEDEQLVVSLVAEGYTVRQIARMYGCSRCAVLWFLRKKGIKAGHFNIDKPAIQMTLHDFKQGGWKEVQDEPVMLYLRRRNARTDIARFYVVPVIPYQGDSD